MRAILVEDGDLVWAQADEPALGPGLVLIENHATAVNRADLAQRAGGYPPPPGASPILGLECAGVVKAVGEGVSRVKEGDEVCALLAGGGYAETVAVPAGQVLPKPAGLTFAEAASIPEVFATAYLNLFMEARMVRGERAVLHAGEWRRHRGDPDVQGLRQPDVRDRRLGREGRTVRRAWRGWRCEPA